METIIIFFQIFITSYNKSHRQNQRSTSIFIHSYNYRNHKNIQQRHIEWASAKCRTDTIVSIRDHINLTNCPTRRQTHTSTASKKKPTVNKSYRQHVGFLCRCTTSALPTSSISQLLDLFWIRSVDRAISEQHNGAWTDAEICSSTMLIWRCKLLVEFVVLKSHVLLIGSV